MRVFQRADGSFVDARSSYHTVLQPITRFTALLMSAQRTLDAAITNGDLIGWLGLPTREIKCEPQLSASEKRWVRIPSTRGDHNTPHLPSAHRRTAK